MTSGSTCNIHARVFHGTKAGEEVDENLGDQGDQGIVGYAKTKGDDNKQELLDELRV